MQNKYLCYEPIKIEPLLQKARHEQAGAVLIFSGETRNHHQGREVLFLEYYCQEDMAARQLQKIILESKKRWNLLYAHIIHRLGKIPFKESSVVIITVAAHRQQAYAANRYLIEALKKEVPIWKKEYYADGNIEWQ